MGIKLFLMVTGLWVMHPIHVSITDVEHDKERQALEFTSRIFLDDIEKHIQYIVNEPYLDLTQPKTGFSSKKLIKEYFLERMSVEVNGKLREIDYLGHEIDGDAVNVYYQILNIKKLKSLSVANNILLDLYSDQVNMTHVKFNGSLKSMKATPENSRSTLYFNEDE